MSPHALIGAELGYVAGPRWAHGMRRKYVMATAKCSTTAASEGDREKGELAFRSIGRGLGSRRVDCGRGTPNSPRSRRPRCPCGRGAGAAASS